MHPGHLPSLCRFLFWDMGCSFGGMIAEEHPSHWQLYYRVSSSRAGWIEVLLQLPIETTTVPSIAPKCMQPTGTSARSKIFSDFISRDILGWATLSFTTKSGVKASTRCARVSLRTSPLWSDSSISIGALCW